ncbi:MAG: YggS family pyridoxal phosphate-dependent enzyme [Lachnospiraceae bacterium]|nr:YggS family pyridoxal phosphate-dependent enzyme [Lachnospiraceae bacterium]MBR5916639.1 YggS family pyridoxal phosphate-dependent enzyme [Lachnospiraceae bacterium]
MSELLDNIKEVEKNIDSSVNKSNRNREDVTLIAVSKTKAAEMIQELYDAGYRDFGENYVQELSEKMNLLPEDIRWHMIGHLQTNKIKYIIDKVYMIHSVDSLHLAQAIGKEARKRNITAKILLEVNVAEEDTKFGFTSENLEENFKEIKNIEGIEVWGLMTSAPYVENAEENRQYFVKLRSLMVDLKDKGLYNKNRFFLSMGMTCDYTVAIEEGADFVRVGTAIFGARKYV